MSTKKINQLQELLNFYSTSHETLEKFKASNFVVIAGPAVSGKDTLREGLLIKYPEIYQRILSTTTRSPRLGENEEKSYKFVGFKQILDLAKKRELLQIALVHNQQISAIDSSEIDALDKNKIGLSILIVQTERELQALKPDLKTIFLIPPSYGEFLKRLSSERQTNKAELKRRLIAAKQEIEIALAEPRLYCLVSKTQKYTTDKAHEFLAHDKKDTAADTQARGIMQTILEKL